VNQLRRGAQLIEDQEERARLAKLLLEAGEKAMSGSSFLMAASHLNLGLKILGSFRWQDHYHLSLSLANAAAEAECSNANFSQMDSLIEEVLRNAHDKHDKIQALTLTIWIAQLPAGVHHLSLVHTKRPWLWYNSVALSASNCV
jgi:predicted ATPase